VVEAAKKKRRSRRTPKRGTARAKRAAAPKAEATAEASAVATEILPVSPRYLHDPGVSPLTKAHWAVMDSRAVNPAHRERVYLAESVKAVDASLAALLADKRNPARLERGLQLLRSFAKMEDELQGDRENREMSLRKAVLECEADVRCAEIQAEIDSEGGGRGFSPEDLLLIDGRIQSAIARAKEGDRTE
jgi:hypothetical protein